jgi:hypothetical protein
LHENLGIFTDANLSIFPDAHLDIFTEFVKNHIKSQVHISIDKNVFLGKLAYYAGDKRGRPFGDEKWIMKAATELSLESSLRSLGRPRKEAEI